MNKITIFLDIDGTLLYQEGDLRNMLEKDPEVLPNVRKTLDKWHILGYNIILVSSRPEGTRTRTIEQLNKVGIYHYSKLILGLEVGPRIIINDSVDKPRAFAIPLERNKGIGDIDIERII